MRPVLNRLLYFPSRAVPAAPGPFEDRWFEAADGTRLHGWWLAAVAPAAGHVLLCHGNAGNIADRVTHAALLAAAGFDVLIFDYRGYGRSAGRPDEAGTYLDARAARAALLREPGVGAERVLYLGESLGAAVALELALEHPPAGLVLQSAFTSVRDMARLHYPLIPRGLVPDAYPSLRLIRDLRAPLLVIHGERDEIVPAEHGRALHDAAGDPKRLRILPQVGHNDLIAEAGDEWAAAVGGDGVARWR
jgi:fermentation-respiration switch protein FrsA (DUF1100 family)